MSRANSDPMGRRRVLRALLAPPLAALAAGCEVPGKGPPPILYRLTPKSTFREDLPTVSWQLVLELPLANAGLSTTRIALYRDPTNLEYYARASWTDRAPGMVLTLMIESFENSGKIVAVGRGARGHGRAVPGQHAAVQDERRGHELCESHDVRPPAACGRPLRRSAGSTRPALLGPCPAPYRRPR